MDTNVVAVAWQVVEVEIQTGHWCSESLLAMLSLRTPEHQLQHRKVCGSVSMVSVFWVIVFFTAVLSSIVCNEWHIVAINNSTFWPHWSLPLWNHHTLHKWHLTCNPLNTEDKPIHPRWILKITCQYLLDHPAEMIWATKNIFRNHQAAIYFSTGWMRKLYNELYTCSNYHNLAAVFKQHLWRKWCMMMVRAACSRPQSETKCRVI